MSVHFAEKLAPIPGYVAGAPAGKAPESIADEGIAQLASNESPFGPHPAVAEAIARAAAAANRYPDPSAACCGGASPSATRSSPAGVALANGSCEILLAAALALCEPGAELVYAWPSFSMYPYLAPLSGAREIRVPLADGDVHDLDAMLDRDHRRDPARPRLQPEQPDRDPPRRPRGSRSSAPRCPTT